MARDPQLVVALEARLNKFEKDLKQAGLIADREVRNIEGRFSKMNPRIQPGFFKGLLGGAIGALSIDRLATSIQRVVGDVAKLGDVSDRVGITAEQLQELAFALEQSGGEAAQAGPAMERFANNIVRATDETSRMGRFLAANNVALRDQSGALRPIAELLADVANLIQNARTPQERLNIAVEFFGRSAGPAMAAALANGARGLQALGAQAQQAGAVLDNELVRKAKEIDDRWQQLARTFGTTVKGAIISLLEAVERLSRQSSIAAAMEAGTESAQQLAEAIALARSKGSPVDPSWITQLERLLELQREASRGRGFSLPPVAGSTLPGAQNSGRPTETGALNSRMPTGESLDQFERATASVEKRIAVLNAEIATIDAGTAAQERARVAAELYAAAQAANEAAGLKNTEVTVEQREEIERLADAFGAAAARAEEARNPLAEFAREARNTTLATQEVALSGIQSLEDALVDVVTRTQDAKEAFRNMANAILADIARLAIRQAITGPIAGLLGGGGIFGGFRAAGGPVSASTPYVVGEKGPEIFVPKTAGNIVPNHIARKGGRDGGVTVNISMNPVFQAGMTPTDMAAINAQLERTKQEMKRETIEAIRVGQRNNSSFISG